MTFGVFIGCVALGLSTLALIIFPDFRKKLKILSGGFLNVFIEDRAKTPEGANAIFQQAIDVAQDKYNKANTLLRQRSGELEMEKENLITTNKKLADLEKSCERLVQIGKDQDAEILAIQREELLVDIERQKKLVESLGPVVEECKTIAAHQENTLHQLKIKRKQIIADLQMNKQMSEMYDDLDELKKTSTVNKLLESVEEGHLSSKQEAIGAKIVHQNKLETKANNAQLELKNIKNNDYIESLKKKYEKV
ncbi:PspA/IM30 family protein [Lacrimispora amygdalina]|uniref:PspA/IM30 family protein n=1 Tax=Lacrimispora amygdalina TaxID=253257 RepID=UPI000BE3F92B|nr:hypothetical protein [Lacrimispora amygdalina]